MSETYFYPSREDPQFLITLDVQEYYVDFVALECLWTPEFLDDGTVAWGWQHVGNTMVPLPLSEDGTDLYLRGFIKWDLCSHYYFGEDENPGYLHLCGPEAIKRHADLMLHLHETCLERLGDKVLK